MKTKYFQNPKRTLFASLKFFFLLFILSCASLQLNAQKKSILFFGDSITAGYGLDKSQAYPAIIQNISDSLGYNLNIINSGLSGETSAGGLRRINWVLQQKVDIFVLELGGNDGLRGISTGSSFKNLSDILVKVEQAYPEAKLVVAGMQMPPNMGENYTKSFAEIFPRLAEKHDAYLIPFILQDVGGIKDLNQADGIHPTLEGHQIIAKNVWAHLKQLLD